MARAPEDRVLTVPNGLSAVRLLGIPVFLWLLLARRSRYAAAVLLSALCLTDWVDGVIARRFEQESKLGKALDPAVDRLIIAAAFVAILVDRSLPLSFAVPAMVREAGVSAGAVAMARKGARIDVHPLGKAGNAGLMTALPLFLAANPHGGAPWHRVARPLARVAAGAGLSLSWASAVLYAARARQALAEARAG